MKKFKKKGLTSLYSGAIIKTERNKEDLKMKYTVIINEKEYHTNNLDTVMCLMAENPTAVAKKNR